MANYTYEIAEDIVFPGITVYRQLKDGVHNAYRAYSNEGYVMFDTADQNYVMDPEIMEIIPVTYYYTMAGFPVNYNFDHFTWVAAPSSEVNETYRVS